MPMHTRNVSWARFVRSALDRVIIFGERRLRHALSKFLVHYHGERNHQGLGQRFDCADFWRERSLGSLLPRPLGGLLRYYYYAP